MSDHHKNPMKQGKVNQGEEKQLEIRAVCNMRTTLPVVFSKNAHKGEKPSTQPDGQKTHTHTHTPSIHADPQLCYLCSTEDTAAGVLLEGSTESLQVNLYPWLPFTYLGKVVFVLTLLEGIAVEICRLIGQLGDDSVFHLICWFNSSR